MLNRHLVCHLASRRNCEMQSTYRRPRWNTTTVPLTSLERGPLTSTHSFKRMAHIFQCYYPLTPHPQSSLPASRAYNLPGLRGKFLQNLRGGSKAPTRSWLGRIPEQRWKWRRPKDPNSTHSQGLLSQQRPQGLPLNPSSVCSKASTISPLTSKFTGIVRIHTNVAEARGKEECQILLLTETIIC